LVVFLIGLSSTGLWFEWGLSWRCISYFSSTISWFWSTSISLCKWW